MAYVAQASQREYSEEENYKNQLNALCQRITGESMGKTDIVYDTRRQDGGFQATVTLVCLSGQQATGDVCISEKEAERSAALFALVIMQSELNRTGESMEKQLHELSPVLEAAACSAGINSPEELTDFAVKAMMHEAIKQALDRKLDKGDIICEYENGEKSGTFVAHLRLPAVPGDIGSTVFSGRESCFRRDSHIDACVKALEAVLSDPLIGYRIDLTDKIKVKTVAEKKAEEKQIRSRKLAETKGVIAPLNGKILPLTGKIVPLAGKNQGVKGKAKGIGKGSKTIEAQSAMYEQMAFEMAMANPMQMMNMMSMMSRRSNPYLT